MYTLNKISKLFAFLTILFCSIWIGAYISRLFLSYQLFEAQDLSLKSYITPVNLTGILTTLLPAITTTFVSYICFIIAFGSFLLISQINLRNNGWLFIIVIITLITSPIETYLMTIDYNIILQLNSSNFNQTELIELFIRRIKVFGSFPLIEIFCYFSFYYFLLFRPLTKIKNEN